jgi:hypothetical protein
MLLVCKVSVPFCLLYGTVYKLVAEDQGHSADRLFLGPVREVQRLTNKVKYITYYHLLFRKRVRD